ncbi:MAG: 1-acyl-sn-glycerol-3-phosphate acyltransferase [Prolixibacteraceae bacterium]|nr:1-acyl-sn-glycerol-3-phosphate acyltransferase [Prolixibacteraceae bacterium]
MKVFYRIVLFPLAFIRFVLLWLVTIFFALTVLFENRFYRRTGNFHFWSARNWGKTCLFILGLRCSKNTFPEIHRFILMPNHRSYLDIMVCAAYSSSAFVAKQEVKKWPVLGQALSANQSVLVKRGELKSLLNTMQAIKTSLEKGVSIILFPEGTTSYGPGILPFKSGSFKIAAELQVPVIPCAIHYLDPNMAWIGSDTLIPHFFRQFWQLSSEVKLRFGEPLISTDHHQLKAATKEQIIQMLENMA